MRATRRRLRHLVVLAALVAATALATAPAASALEQPPSPGSSQGCLAVKGGFLLEIVGFGDHFPPNTTGTTTFTLANGDVFVRMGTTNFEGIFHTDPLILDLRDPAIAALVGTTVQQSSSFGGVEAGFSYTLVGCPTAPDGRPACMDGGFESYPALGFLNQGDCISWIATQGKNEPGQNVP
jgi:hypothetical protein